MWSKRTVNNSLLERLADHAPLFLLDVRNFLADFRNATLTARGVQS
jgi:hypothetical protein